MLQNVANTIPYQEPGEAGRSRKKPGEAGRSRVRTPLQLLSGGPLNGWEGAEPSPFDQPILQPLATLYLEKS